MLKWIMLLVIIPVFLAMTAYKINKRNWQRVEDAKPDDTHAYPWELQLGRKGTSLCRSIFLVSRPMLMKDDFGKVLFIFIWPFQRCQAITGTGQFIPDIRVLNGQFDFVRPIKRKSSRTGGLGQYV